MKLTSVCVWQVDPPLKEGRHSWSDCNFVDVFDSTYFEIALQHWDDRLASVARLAGPTSPPLPREFGRGFSLWRRAALGLDPRQHDVVNRAMDRVFLGHPYVKLAIDVACWDAAGKQAGVPVHSLLGSAARADVPLYRAISQRPAAEMAENIEGYCAGRLSQVQAEVRRRSRRR